MQSNLANQLRPTTLEDFLGQTHLVGPEGPIRSLIETDQLPSMLFWGPPASGKTTLAEIIAANTQSEFLKISAVMDGKDELRRVIQEAQRNKDRDQRTILFIDEIHRWSKAQQDALLPFVENDTLILIGATTENPSFEVIPALLSRSRVFVFEPLSKEDIVKALERGLKALGKEEFLDLPEMLDILGYLAELSYGDVRFALNSLEIAVNLNKDKPLTKALIERATQKSIRYDKNGEEHYNIISAVHKSMRSSNPTAAVYWTVRMLQGGEDPLYIARRMLRFASEDIGNASPTALLLANTVFDTCHKLGMPECGVALVQLAEYLARAPKNNKAYAAYNRAVEDVRKFGELPVPLHLRNAPTKLMEELGYSQGYQYDHDLENKKSEQQCLPDQLAKRDYFE
jgi:putative ATPase